ncbi:MAG: glycosyltransferase family 2 protein, partial [Gammaproteobacteria bacterium]|nr:glycosyltransferase family 2 protein [Gammaproteobacteria bacterium]
VQWSIPEPGPLISLIVLTRDRVSLLTDCVTGLMEGTDYKNIEIIIVDNGSEETSTLDYLDAIKQKPNVTVIREPSEYNFSRLNNIAIKHAKGDYIGLINNDISIIEPYWLHEMMGHILREDVGIVGPKLLYANNTIQHAGVIVGLGGVAGHAFRHQPHHSRGYDDRLMLTQQLSCVTAACLLTKKSIYNKVEGLNETSLKVAFNDVDYCLKVRELGYKVIWTPFATLYHLESASRSSDLSKENIGRWNSEFSYMTGKWSQVLEKDPFYNPNLTIADEDFSYSIPPRQHKPWEGYLQTKS